MGVLLALMDGCPASAQYTDPDGEFLVLVGMLIGGYTAYNQAKDLGMSDSSVFAAAAFGAAIGAVTGGVGSSVAAVTFKQGVAQAFKATTTEAVSKAAQGSVVGGITGSVTSAAIQAVGDDGIDGTQVAVDGIKGGFAGLCWACWWDHHCISWRKHSGEANFHCGLYKS